MTPEKPTKVVVKKVIRRSKKLKRRRLTRVLNINLFRRKRRRIKKIKNSHLRNKRKGKRRIRKTIYKMSQKYYDYLIDRLRKLNLSKIRVGILTIKQTRRNCFMVISQKTRKKTVKFQRKRSKKPQYKVLHHKSIGQATIYRGRAKTSAIAKKALGKSMLKFLYKKQIRLVDAIFISEMQRAGAPLLVSVAAKNVVIRSITRRLSRPHGYVRKKKARRI